MVTRQTQPILSWRWLSRSTANGDPTLNAILSTQITHKVNGTARTVSPVRSLKTTLKSVGSMISTIRKLDAACLTRRSTPPRSLCITRHWASVVMRLVRMLLQPAKTFTVVSLSTSSTIRAKSAGSLQDTVLITMHNALMIRSFLSASHHHMNVNVNVCTKQLAVRTRQTHQATDLASTLLVVSGTRTLVTGNAKKTRVWVMVLTVLTKSKTSQEPLMLVACIKHSTQCLKATTQRVLINAQSLTTWQVIAIYTATA